MNCGAHIERTKDRITRWRVFWPAGPDEGMATETLHLTRLGARVSRWLGTPRFHRNGGD